MNADQLFAPPTPEEARWAERFAHCAQHELIALRRLGMSCQTCNSWSATPGHSGPMATGQCLSHHNAAPQPTGFAHAIATLADRLTGTTPPPIERPRTFADDTCPHHTASPLRRIES
jgi:hypothetical protein